MSGIDGVNAGGEGCIVKLPDAVANQIAAGEVVERPVAVVKELVENALDAGAQNIEVQIERGGKQLMRVLDDGCGMSRVDAQMAMERHATSKIRDVADILAIHSFGFRGEALPSIASVAEFRLRTRRAQDEVGTEIRVNGGRGLKVEDCATPVGTEVTVRNLFNSVPARRKFLKSERTEAGHIVQTVRLIAAAHPQVGFVLIEDGREHFRSPCCRGLAERLGDLLGHELARRLQSFERTEGRYRVHGVLGGRDCARSTRADLHFYMNGRPVESRLLSYAVIESCHPHLGRGRYPLAYVFVEVPPESVDVNVHPAKREVRFRDEGFVRRIVMEAVGAQLKVLFGIHHGAAAAQGEKAETEAGSWSAVDSPRVEITPPPAPPCQDPSVGAVISGRSQAVPAPQIVPTAVQKRAPEQPEALGSALAPRSLARAANVDAGEKTTAAQPPAERRWRWLGAIAGGRYGVFENAEGLVCLSGRAAWERITFEAICDELAGIEVEQQALIFPQMLDFNPVEAVVLQENLKLVTGLGFELEAFGRSVFRMRAHPAWLDAGIAEQLVRDIVQRLREGALEFAGGGGTMIREKVALLALNRLRDWPVPKGMDDWNTLVARLLRCRQPLVDPRGRPVLKLWDHRQIESLFA